MPWAKPYAVNPSEVDPEKAKEFLDDCCDYTLSLLDTEEFNAAEDAILQVYTVSRNLQGVVTDMDFDHIRDTPIAVLSTANRELWYRSAIATQALMLDVGDQKSPDVLKEKINELRVAIHTAGLAHAEFIDCHFKRTSKAMPDAGEVDEDEDDEGTDEDEDKNEDEDEETHNKEEDNSHLLIFVRPPEAHDDLKFTAMTKQVDDERLSRRRKAFYASKAAHLASHTLTPCRVARSLGPAGLDEEDQLITVRAVVKNRDTIKTSVLMGLNPKMRDQGLQNLDSLAQALVSFEDTLRQPFDEEKRKLTWSAVQAATKSYVLTFADLMRVPVGGDEDSVNTDPLSEATTTYRNPKSEAATSGQKLSNVELPLSAMPQKTLPSTTPLSDPSR